MLLSFMMASIGVQISDIISQLIGTMSYFPLLAISCTVENSGKNFIKSTSADLSGITKKSLTDRIDLSRTNILISAVPP